MIKKQILKAFLILISSGLLVKQAESAVCVGTLCTDYGSSVVVSSVVESSFVESSFVEANLTCNYFSFEFFK